MVLPPLTSLSVSPQTRSAAERWPAGMLAAPVTVLFRAGQRHHRGGEAHGAAHGRDVAPGQRRQRQQARPHPVRQGHRQGV